MLHSRVAPESQNFKPTTDQPFLKGLGPSILIGAVFPVLIYRLASPHVATLAALALGAVPPMLYSAYGWARTRTVEPVSLIALCTLGASMVVSLVGHDPHLFLIHDSYLTGAFGLLCLISLLFPTPLAFYVHRWAFVRPPEQHTALNARSQAPHLRAIQRRVTLVWGLAFVAETLVDTFLGYHLATADYVAIHPFVYWGTILVFMGGAALYSRYALKNIETR